METFDARIGTSANLNLRNVSILIVVLAMLGIGVRNTSADLLSFLKTFVPLGIAIVIVSYIFFFKKAYKSFATGEEGIKVNDKLYTWNSFKDFHLLGDSQSERMGGLVSLKVGDLNTGIDPINEYAGTNVFVLRKHSIFSNMIYLQVAPEQAGKFANILIAHGIQRESKLKMFFLGMNKWFVILVIVPFILLLIWMFK